MSHTQKDLLEIAQKHSENPAVKCLLSSIEGAQSLAQVAYYEAQIQLRFIGDMLAPDRPREVCSCSDLARPVANLHAHMATTYNYYGTLACVLQALGETIEY